MRGDGGGGGAGGQECQGRAGDVPGVTQAHLGLTQQIVVTVSVAWPLVRSVSPAGEKSGQ